MNLCEYGCGEIAKFKFKNGKWCCSKNFSSCPMNRKKNKIGQKLTSIKTTELCSFGCGQVGNYKFKNGKLCCSKNFSKCPINRKKISENVKGRVMPKSIPIETTKLCSYGCGQVAKYISKSGKLCCNDHFTKCPKDHRKRSEIQKGKMQPKAIPIKTIELCSHGCGQVAKYKFKNGNICCSKRVAICPMFKRTIEKIKKDYPTFYKAEDLKYNPDKPNEKEIQVRCNYNKCKNSKENNGWFTPTKSQMHERIRRIEESWGNDGCFFYCSDKCKEECILFGLRSDPFKEITMPHTSAEINIWRQEVLKRQKDEYGYNSCEICDLRINLQIHHEKPQKTHPNMTLDPDNGIVLCKKCHYKIGHKTGTECSTGNLANHNPC